MLKTILPSLLLSFFVWIQFSSDSPTSFFVPCLIFLSSYLSFSSLLWLSFLFGFLLDLVSSSWMGENLWVYMIPTFCLLYKKKIWIEENPLYFALFSALFVFLGELFRWLFFVSHATGGKNLAIFLISCSFSTACYAILGWTFPIEIGKKILKIFPSYRLLRR